jgi:hypothetical protein
MVRDMPHRIKKWPALPQGQEVRSMGKLFSVVLLVLSLLLPAPVLSLEPSPIKAEAEYGMVQSTGIESVSGRIVAIRGKMFTLAVRENPVQGLHLQQKPVASPMTFFIDENTTVEGSLQLNADAEVVYRQQDGNNVAVNVRVTNQS